MSIFKRSPARSNRPEASEILGKIIKSPIPTEHFDTTKRFDIYCLVANEYRVYANMRLIALKTLGDFRENGFTHHAFLEIEASDGTRTMVPMFPIHAICEHGTKSTYAVLKKPGE